MKWFYNIVLLLLLIVGCTQQTVNQTASDVVTKDNCVGESCLLIQNLSYPVGELPVDVINALNTAINDEYKAHAVYDAVIKKFGSVKPFIMIIRAEEQHISSLKELYDKYGVVIPADNWLGNVTVPDSIKDSCQLGVDAEIANAALYKDELLPLVTDYPDITAVFNSLMSASEVNHLTAFKRCA